MGGERINLLDTKFRPSVHHFCSIDERCSEKKKHHFLDQLLDDKYIFRTGQYCVHV